jgi:hypothetical protein
MAVDLTSLEIVSRFVAVGVRTVECHLGAACAKNGTGSRIRLANWLAGSCGRGQDAW